MITLFQLALTEIGKLARFATTDTAADAIATIRGIYDAVERADQKKITYEGAKNEIRTLLGALKENDAAADAALKSKS